MNDDLGSGSAGGLQTSPADHVLTEIKEQAIADGVADHHCGQLFVSTNGRADVLLEDRGIEFDNDRGLKRASFRRVSTTREQAIRIDDLAIVEIIAEDSTRRARP